MRARVARSASIDADNPVSGGQVKWPCRRSSEGNRDRSARGVGDERLRYLEGSRSNYGSQPTDGAPLLRASHVEPWLRAVGG